MSNENIVFRTSVSGYNKKDVYKYLENVNKDIKEKSVEYEKRITELEKETIKLSEEKDSLDTLSRELKEQNDSLNTKLNEKESELGHLLEENAKTNDALALIEKENNEKEALIEELDSAAVKISLEIDSLAEQYAELVSKYEEAIATPDNIIELKRKSEAYDKIISRAKEKKSTQTVSLNTTTEEKHDIDSILSGSAQEILNHIKQTQQKFSEAIANAQKESDLLKERVNNVINSSKEKILSQIK